MWIEYLIIKISTKVSCKIFHCGDSRGELQIFDLINTACIKTVEVFPCCISGWELRAIIILFKYQVIGCLSRSRSCLLDIFNNCCLFADNY